MARKNRQYSSALSALEDTNVKDTKGIVTDEVQEQSKPVKEEVKVEDKPKQEAKKEKVTSKRKSKTETKDVNVKSKHNSETTSLDDLKNSINEMFEEKQKKKTMEETHTRTTFLVENDLLKDFNDITEGKRGYKTMLINQLLQAVVDSHKKE